MDRHSILSETDTQLCIWGGAAGLGLSLASGIQHQLMNGSGGISTAMTLGFLFVAVSYIAVIWRRYWMQWLLIPALLVLLCFLALTLAWMMSRGHVYFSPINWILAAYTLTAVVVLFAREIPAKCRAVQREKELEEQVWRGKLG